MAFPIWPAAWRANLPWAGAADAFTTIGNLPDGGQLTGIINDIAVVDDYAEKVVSTAAAVMVDDDVLFEADGPILIMGLVSECITVNDATASTLQYRVNPDEGDPVTISAASSSLANLDPGATVSLVGTALNTAAAVNTSGANLGMTAPIAVMAGDIEIAVGVGSTTGTWRHHLRYKPLARNVSVVAP